MIYFKKEAFLVGYIGEYLQRNMTILDYQQELRKLILEYNSLMNTHLFIFAADACKNIPDMPICQKDYYIIYDMLSNKHDINSIHVYLETPGGSGEAAEDIINFLRKHFNEVWFVISGEAKSAGTIIALSGDEILMTETASLGPIDAQVPLGRSVISASDYMEWVLAKQAEATETGILNHFDAIVIAQITPGELLSIKNSLEFAKDLVTQNLKKYKFRNWMITETRREVVTPERRQARAEEIADKLANHSEWRSHGRSIKRETLVNLGLKIINIEENERLSEIVHRIHVVLRLLFDSSSVFKIFMDANSSIRRHAVERQDANIAPPVPPDAIEVNLKCEQCQHEHKLYGKFTDDPDIDKDMLQNGKRPIPPEGKISCENCGREIDLAGIINDIEAKMNRKLLLG